MDGKKEEELLRFDLPLNRQRVHFVSLVATVMKHSKIVDFGCGRGPVLEVCGHVPSVNCVVGIEKSVMSLRNAVHCLSRCRGLLDHEFRRLTPLTMQLIEGDLCREIPHGLKNGKRLGCSMIEVLEHLPPHDFAKCRREIFENSSFTSFFITTPNSDFNALLPSNSLFQNQYSAIPVRHLDHRTELSRTAFHKWVADTLNLYPQFVCLFVGFGAPPLTMENSECQNKVSPKVPPRKDSSANSGQDSIQFEIKNSEWGAFASFILAKYQDETPITHDDRSDQTNHEDKENGDGKAGDAIDAPRDKMPNGLPFLARWSLMRDFNCFCDGCNCQVPPATQCWPNKFSEPNQPDGEAILGLPLRVEHAAEYVEKSDTFGYCSQGGLFVRVSERQALKSVFGGLSDALLEYLVRRGILAGGVGSEERLLELLRSALMEVEEVEIDESDSNEGEGTHVTEETIFEEASENSGVAKDTERCGKSCDESPGIRFECSQRIGRCRCCEKVNRLCEAKHSVNTDNACYDRGGGGDGNYNWTEYDEVDGDKEYSGEEDTMLKNSFECGMGDPIWNSLLVHRQGRSRWSPRVFESVAYNESCDCVNKESHGSCKAEPSKEDNLDEVSKASVMKAKRNVKAEGLCRKFATVEWPSIENADIPMALLERIYMRIFSAQSTTTSCDSSLVEQVSPNDKIWANRLQLQQCCHRNCWTAFYRPHSGVYGDRIAVYKIPSIASIWNFDHIVRHLCGYCYGCFASMVEDFPCVICMDSQPPSEAYSESDVHREGCKSFLDYTLYVASMIVAKI